MFKHILLPTDGSELSRKAAASGIQLAKALGARVTGLSVVVESPVAAGIGKAMVHKDEDIKAVEAFLRELGEEATRQGVAHECFYVRADSPSEGIISTATRKGCDLIFMASHGRRGLTRLLLGSETMQVLTHGKIPVLVYR